MYLTEVIPLTNIPLGHPQSYTYYSSFEVSLGNVVVVPVRNRKVEAIVINVSPLKSQKMLLRQSGYQLKGILDLVISEPIVDKEQFDFAYWMSEYYRVSLGMILKTITPKYAKRWKKQEDEGNIEATGDKLFFGLANKEKKLIKKTAFSDSNSQTYLISGKSDWRHFAYIAQQLINANKQLLFLVPEALMLKPALAEFQKYLGKERVVELHAGLAKTVYWQNWHKVKKNSAKVIIGTRSAVFTPFEHLGAILMKDAKNTNYKQWDMTPKYDARDLVKYIANEKKIKLFLEEELPSISSTQQIRDGKYVPLVFSSVTPVFAGMTTIIDMREELLKKNFSMFSEKLAAGIEQSLKEQKKSFLFINRRGTSTFIMCRDCGYIEKCPNCDVSLVYHASLKNRLYCHHCGFSADIPLQCPKCQGTRIKYFGVGSERVEAEAKKTFPQTRVVRIDSDIVKNQKEQEKVFEMIKSGKADIIIGTQMAVKDSLPELGFMGVITMDSMLNLPDYDGAERALRIIYELQKRSERCIIQTYNPDNQVFQAVKNNDIKGFYEQELQIRKVFDYPPFARIVKLTCRDKDNKKCRLDMEAFSAQVNSLNLGKKIHLNGPFPAFVTRTKGQYNWQIILKLLSPDYRVRTKVFDLIPTYWEVDVNPESLL